MRPFLTAWANFLTRFKWVVILLTPITVFLLSAPAANVYFAHSPDMWFLEEDPTNQDYDTLTNQFGEAQNLLVGFSQADGSTVIEADLLEAVREVHEFLLTRDEVIDVQSLVNYQFIGSEDDTLTMIDLLDREGAPFGLIPSDTTPAQIETLLAGEPIVLGDLITEDMRNTALVAELQMSEDGRVDHHIAVVDALKEFNGLSAYADKGIEINIFGRPYISHQLTTGTIQDQSLFYALLIVLALSMSLLVFRDFRALMGPFMVVFNSIMIVYAVQGAIGWPTTVANALMPFLVIIIGIGISAHVMITHFRNLGQGLEPREALAETMCELIKPASFSVLTTIFGFVGLGVTLLQPLREYALLAIVGVLACFFFCFTLLPAILSSVKRVPRWFQESAGPTRSNPLVAISQWSMDRAGWVLGFGALIMAGSIAATATLKLDTNFVHIFKTGSEFQTSFNYFDEEFEGGQSVEIVLDSGSEGGVYDPKFLADADALLASLDSYNGLGKARSIIDYIKQMNVELNNSDEAFRVLPDSAGATAQMLLLYENAGPERGLEDLVSPDRRHLRISIGARNMSAVETNEVITSLEADIAHNWPELNVMLTGDLVLYNRLETLIANGMIVSFGVALITISLSMLALFRSARTTVYAVLPSVFPIFVAGAVMKVTGIFPDINSLIVASVTIGLAVDDSIHFLVRYDAARKKGQTVDMAVRHAIDGCGYALLFSTLVLGAGFAIFLFATLQSGVNFGLLSVVVIGTAFLADLILLPAFLKVVDRRRVGVPSPDARRGLQSLDLKDA